MFCKKTAACTIMCWRIELGSSSTSNLQIMYGYGGTSHMAVKWPSPISNAKSFHRLDLIFLGVTDSHFYLIKVTHPNKIASSTFDCLSRKAGVERVYRPLLFRLHCNGEQRQQPIRIIVLSLKQHNTMTIYPLFFRRNYAGWKRIKPIRGHHCYESQTVNGVK